MTFPAYSNYRDTGLGWLGKVPTQWSEKPFWALFRREKRTGFPNEQLLSVYRDYGVIRKADRDDNFNKPSEDLSAYQLVEEGDLAINKMKAWQGSVGISRHRGIVSPAYFVYRAQHKENNGFLHYLLRSLEYTAGYRSLSKGIRVNQWDLDPTYHSRMRVVLPSTEEQVAIAAFLDREIAKIDALVAAQERLISLLKEKRKAVISRAVTKGLALHAPMKDSGIEWLGDVPAHWKIIPLKRLGFFNAGAGFPDAEQGVSDQEIPFHKVNALGRADKFGRLGEADNTISRETAARLRAYVFPKGSIVFAKIGAALLLGRIRQLSEPSCLDNNLMGFMVNDDVDVDFVRFSMDLVRFDYISNPGTVPSLNESQIANVQIALPPSEEQRQISSFLAAMVREFDDLQEAASRAMTLLQERKGALISAAVTGKIDVRGAVAVKAELEVA